MRLKKIISLSMIVMLLTAMMGVSAYAVTDTSGSNKVRGTTYSKSYNGSNGKMSANGNDNSQAITIIQTKGKYYATGYVGRYTYTDIGTKTYTSLASFSGTLNMIAQNIAANRNMASYTYDYVHGASFYSGTNTSYMVDNFMYTARQYY